MKAESNGLSIQAAGRARGAFLLIAFGMLWLLFALVPGAASHPLRLIVAIIVCAPLLAVAHASSQVAGTSTTPIQLSESALLSRRRFKTINKAQWASLMVCNSVLAITGHYTLIEPVSVTIIGLHFFALAQVYKETLYWITGFTFLALSGLNIWLPSTIDAGNLAIGVGLTLWASALYQLSESKLKALAQIDFWRR